MTRNRIAIDYNFRPATYWDKKQRQLANITGTHRRLAAKYDLATRGHVDPTAARLQRGRALLSGQHGPPVPQRRGA